MTSSIGFSLLKLSFALRKDKVMLVLPICDLLRLPDKSFEKVSPSSVLKETVPILKDTILLAPSISFPDSSTGCNMF